MKYGAIEFQYAKPFADALISNAAFRKWLLKRTPFSDHSTESEVLADKMKSGRSKKANNWWQSYYTEACRCSGCSGQETDILAIFSTATHYRFALHVEVKQPKDTFKAGGKQAESYQIRAKCWANDKTRPKTVIEHNDAATLLLCSERKLVEYGENTKPFNAVITFEEIAREFPQVYSKRLFTP